MPTIRPVATAQQPYRSLGFEERRAYYHNPLDDAVYMERSL